MLTQSQRAVLEELRQDLARAQSSVDSAVSDVGIAARTAERSTLMGAFTEPINRAADALAAIRWQLEGHLAIVRAEIEKLPPEERKVRNHARHA